MLGIPGTHTPRQAYGTAEAAVLQALQLDDRLAETHSSLAFILLEYDWEWPAAEREHRRTLEINNFAPAHHWYGLNLMQMARFRDAEAALDERLQAVLLHQVPEGAVGKLEEFGGARLHAA